VHLITKPVGKGTGPVFLVAYSLTGEYNGDIPVNSDDGKGPTFTVILTPYGKVARSFI
jgi:signal transduction histidine kinase